MATSEQRARDRDLGAHLQEEFRQAEHHSSGSDRCRALRRVDRRHSQRARRRVVPAAVYAPTRQEDLESDQPRAREAADRRRAHAAGRPATDRRCQGGRPLDRGVRADARNDDPEDLRATIDASPRAKRTFATLGRQNLFALAFRTNNMKTPAGRAKKIAALVAMLARGETIIPERERQRKAR